MIDNLHAIKKVGEERDLYSVLIQECLKRFVSSFLVKCYKIVVGSYRLDALKTF